MLLPRQHGCSFVMQWDERMVLTGKPLNNKRVPSYNGELKLSVAEGIVVACNIRLSLRMDTSLSYVDKDDSNFCLSS